MHKANSGIALPAVIAVIEIITIVAFLIFCFPGSPDM
jgi:hypothetical protein